MAMPRFLYSVTASMLKAPLLNENTSDDELELALSADQNPPSEDHSDRFDQEVVLSPIEIEKTKSDIYTSARLAAAGIPDPSNEEDGPNEYYDPIEDDDEQLLDVSSRGYAVNAPEGGHGAYKEISYNYQMRSSPRPSSTVSVGDDAILYKNDRTRTKHEDAALYVREGEDNDKFYQHPRGKWSKRAYQVLHSTVYHVFNLCVCTLLLFLALMEHPYLGEGEEANLPDSTLVTVIVVHALLEIFLLSLLWLDMVLRFLWFRPKNFFTHRRTLLILVVLVVMSVEAVVVLARQQNHIRITRALRPIFLVDTYLMHGVRRVLRQIFLCIRPILDVIVLLILSLVVFSLLGYLIFAELDITYFESFKRTLVSFFIALTTADLPDMWLEAYIRQPASALFFILYIIVMVYFISNVLLAVVYSSFSEADKNKFKKLFLHKRDALRLAYNVLATSLDGIKFHDFLLFMHEYRPRIPEWQVMCIFKVLHSGRRISTSSDDDDEGVKDLSLEQFYGFYEVFNLKWKRVSSEGEELTWFQHSRPSIKIPANFVHKIVKSNLFNFVINMLLVANLIFLVTYTYFIDKTDVSNRFFILNNVVAVSLVFVCIYVLEICLRIFGLGPYNYFRKPQNILDTLVIFTSFVLLILEAVSPAHSVLAVFRPVKFIRLLRLKRRYRDIINTLYVLSRRLISVGLLLLVVYYAFAIIGMEFLSDTVFEGCCNESMYGVGEYYSGMNETNSNFTINVYYILNFNNVLRSYVTLFVLMVINNWFIIMEGFASTSPNGWLVRIYFMSFYLITLVVLQVIISFIVEAFVFKIQAKERRRRCHKHPDQYCECHKENEGKKVANIKLIKADIDKLRYVMTYSDQTEGVTSLNKWIRHRRRVNLDSLTDTQSLFGGLGIYLAYTGRRLRTKDDIHLLMYRSELVHWIQEKDQEMDREAGKLEEVKKGKASWRKSCGVAWKYLKSGLLYIVE